ncbi:MAG: putative competence-damage inducible protein [Chroococcopsis gigantea SAG 12.99]|jgi:nicotinamide-nucleotide amidase|nr:competence/damage-inducible protein A [Chlorogloea purpurea SAG 13.99]MDV3001569.1 putative competence-damage inducible protein [Chroococcopsis gigantea SAG 12.99]
MAAEIICVGTELLLGDIVNTNAQFLALELASLGIPHYFQTVVGDNIDRLCSAIEIASGRADILIFTGGLGPTPDDLTHDAIGAFFKSPLVEYPEIVADITTKFARIDRPMTPSNLKQALLPGGASILPNPSGTAPGIIWQPRPGLSLLTFPGVPSEMRKMWRETAVTYLKSLGWGSNIIYSRLMRFYGIGESALAAKVTHLFDSSNPTVAPYAGMGEVRLRVSAYASSQTQAVSLIEPVAQEIISIAGLDYFGSDDDSLASIVSTLLLERGETLSVAESCTGGGLGQMLTDMPGSSAYFKGGVIAYDNSVKASLLGVDSSALELHGAVSETVASQMARGVRDRLGTDWGVSITGIAGPGGGTETKPVGLVYIGLANPQGEVKSFEYRFSSYRDRLTIRSLSALSALDRLRRYLLEG